jgi:hypothetical protein
VTAEVRLPLTGGCVCRQLRYELKGAPLLAYACHCHNCQKRSGSAFALQMVIRRADLLVKGEVDAQRRADPAGRELEHSFCPACRGRIWVHNLAAPDYATLRAGTFDDTSWIVPIAQTWVESAIPWAVMPGVRNVPPDVFDFYALGEEWRASAPRFVAEDVSPA